MSDMTPEKAQALLDPIEVDRLAVTSRAMGTVCDATGWQTSTARHHRNVADTLEAQAAEITRLRAQVEAVQRAHMVGAERSVALEDEIARLRTALEWYDDGSSMGTHARAALATYQQKRENGE